MSSMLEIDALTKRFGPLTAVDGVSFSVERGEVLGFLGPNGAGKSTTMKMVTGFLPPTSGRARVCGFDIGAQPIEAKRKLGYLPEGAPAYPDMTPRSFLRFVAETRGIPKAERARAIDDVVQRVHLEGVLKQPIDTLSKGYRRRVGLAQAILHDPEVLILDEPTDGLDPNQKHEVRSLIREMAAEKAVVLSTHILEEVDAVCTRAMIIDRGRIVFDGSPSSLQQRSPRHGAVSLVLADASADDVARVEGELAGVSGVAEVARPAATDDGRVELVALPGAGARILEPIAALVRDRDWSVGEIRQERGRLDDVFRELTGTDVKGGGA